MHTREYRCRSAFTLVELLVVIGIIAVLIAILLPALIAARRQALIIKCAASMRQVVAAGQLHASEHQGYFPLAGDLKVEYPKPLGEFLTDMMREPISLLDTDKRRYSYFRLDFIGNVVTV